MNLVLWLLFSLLAISFSGAHIQLAFGAAIGLGAWLGWKTHHDFVSAQTPERLSHARKSARGLKRVIAKYGWGLDALATLLLIVSSRTVVIGFALVAVSFALRWWTRGAPFARTPLNLPIALLSLMIAVGVLVSADILTSLRMFGTLLAGINAYYAITARVHSERDLHWLVGGLLAAASALALVAPWGVEWPQNKLFALGRVYRMFTLLLPDSIHANVLAGLLAPAICVGVAILLIHPLEDLPDDQRRLARVVLAGALALLATMLFLTQSRGALAIVFLGLLILIATRQRWAGALVALGAVIALIVIASLLDFSSLLDLILTSDKISGLSGREEIWSRGFFALQDFPFTGVGLGLFPRVVDVFYPLFMLGAGEEMPHAHNLYLQVGVDVGIPGLVAFAALITAALLLAWRNARIARATKQRALFALNLGALIALFVIAGHGVVDAVVWTSKPAFFVWAWLGVVAASAEIV
ncbi:MAG: O-antigen ligase family protein [Chloroflexi bacterium]|nr:O-antigen ligase family protein [Chloroflexota bacterium]